LRESGARDGNAAGRGLSTARAVLRVQDLLARHPEGVRADHVADALHKSASTAYNLLASLCEEGVAVHQAGGLYRLAPGFRELIATGDAPIGDDLAGVVDELLARTHKRAYLGVPAAGRLRISVSRGQQGMPRIPGLSPVIDDNAHALALGKVGLAAAGWEALERYLAGGLKAFTSSTITDPDELRAELASVRRSGLAIEAEEFEPGFCCMAAPVLDHRRRFLGAIGISMSARAFELERGALARTLRDVAGGRFQPYAESHKVLDRPRPPDLASQDRHAVR
jgi:acetyl-CoA synthetase